MIEPHSDNCKIPGCPSKGRVRRLCKTHYREWRLANPHEWHTKPKQVDQTVNPFRAIWDDRKRKGQLCTEWNDLRAFTDGISPKPEGFYTLCRVRAEEPYGPDNFVWREQIKRRAGESQSQFVKRQRTEQITRHPNFERHRELRRKYGLTPDEFRAMVEAQDNRCAICNEMETRFEYKTGNYRNLCIDHCHTTGKIRGLLCFECNTSLGKLKEDVVRLKAMIAYVEKHLEIVTPG